MDNSILIKRKDFLAMLKPLKRFARKKKEEEAILSMEGGEFYISLIGITTGAPATGNWAGEVRVPARLIWGVAMEPPTGDPVGMEVRDGRLHIGSLSLSCSARNNKKPAENKMAENPLMDRELVKMLRFRHVYSLEELQKNGLFRDVVKAEEKAYKLVSRAAKILAPLNISELELWRMVKEHFRRGISVE